MKMIVFLVLAGVSLAAAGERWECLFDGLKQSPDVLHKYITFICDHSSNNFDANVANYRASFTALKGAVKKIGCSLDDIVGTEDALESASGTTTDVAALAGRVVGNLIGGLGIKGPLSDVLCKLTSKALLSDCLANIVANLVPDKITKVDNLLCKSDYKALSADDLIQFFQEIGCFGDDALGTGDALKTLASGLGDAAAPVLQNVVATLIGLLQELFPGGIPSLGCNLLNIASGGAGGIVGGAGGVVGGVGSIVGGALGAKPKLF
ncbi:uncharacterized protein ACNLHF_026895 isoform 2-T2 [Anomaloglossus baeobatrachus]|uniref:uncharacterized protein LOC142249546 isoform X2 n=1 Tax=Anomaloglossus baeobatrachus TaxID=238106 RepID=UPI003F4F742E